MLQGTLIDLVGLVVYAGRWERELCRLPLDSGPPTGQYWVRLWLQITDHTALEETAAGTVESVAVRIYVEQER
jgi:hypothetical protein